MNLTMLLELAVAGHSDRIALGLSADGGPPSQSLAKSLLVQR